MQGCFELFDMLAEQAAIERGGTHRATAQSCIFGLAMEVGNSIAINEFQRCVFFIKTHHAWAMCEEGTRADFVKLLTQLVAQIRKRFFNGFGHAAAQRQWIAWNPHPPPRPRGGAAIVRVFFDHDDFETQVCSRHCRGQRTRARAHHE